MDTDYSIQDSPPEVTSVTHYSKGLEIVLSMETYDKALGILHIYVNTNILSLPPPYSISNIGFGWVDSSTLRRILIVLLLESK